MRDSDSTIEAEMRKQLRKQLNMEGMLTIVRQTFEKVGKSIKGSITTADCLMSGLAVYGLKVASLLQFEERQQDKVSKQNIKNLYQIEQIPSDTYLREPSMMVPVTPNNENHPQRQILNIWHYNNGVRT